MATLRWLWRRCCIALCSPALKAPSPRQSLTASLVQSGNNDLITNKYLRLLCLYLSAAHQDNYKAMWFDRTHDALTNEETHVYKGGYWEAKDGSGWEDVCPPDIF